jgi:hypothetical protein
LVAIVLTAGARNDMPGFDAIFDALPDDHHLEYAVMDRWLMCFISINIRHRQ